jgi:hypothetical protein
VGSSPVDQFITVVLQQVPLLLQIADPNVELNTDIQTFITQINMETLDHTRIQNNKQFMTFLSPYLF